MTVGGDQLAGLAAAGDEPQVLSLLEGGYDLQALAESTEAHLKAYLDGACGRDEGLRARVDAWLAEGGY